MSRSITSRKSSTRRFEEILRILGKYGLTEWLGDNLPAAIRNKLESADGKLLAEMSRPQRLRMALAELGTTFIKLGQILSTRSDLVGPEIAEELAHLQSSTPADPPEVVRATLETELGHPPEELFAEIDLEAMASASIGQVHRATLQDGQAVVVKVQHDGIEQRVLDDFEILARLAELAERHSSELRLYRPRALVDSFRRDLLRELDFGRESRSLERFRANFDDDPQVFFPRPYPELSDRRVMTMERIEGTSVKHTDALEAAGVDLQDVATRGANLFLRQVFEHGFYHADPHPGNIFVLEGGAICLLDCGMTGRLDDRLRGDIEEMLGAAMDSDSERLTDAVVRLATVPQSFDRAAFEADASEFIEEYADQALENWDFGALINDGTGLIRRHRIQLPASVSLLLRMLVELEGTARMLSPTFSLGEVLRPHTHKAFQRKLDPGRFARRLARDTRDWERLFQNLPRELSELLERARKGTLDIHLRHRGLDATVNRLIYGVLTAALILGASLLWSREIPPLIWGQSVAGVTCAAAAAVLGVRLLRAIESSGKLDRRKDE